jgi:hypothetical protein
LKAEEFYWKKFVQSSELNPVFSHLLWRTCSHSTVLGSLTYFGYKIRQLSLVLHYLLLWLSAVGPAYCVKVTP